MNEYYASGNSIIYFIRNERDIILWALEPD